ncbi:MAG: LuxR C-terminal-related transcriptional regulator [Actinomycetales bacterium]
MRTTAGGASLLAVEAYLAGRYDECVRLWMRAFQEHAAAAEVEDAAVCAHWLAFVAVNRGDLAVASSWVDRGLELLGDRDCPERGYLVGLRGIGAMFSGDTDRAATLIAEAGQAAIRFDDLDLTVLSRLGQGHLLIQQGRTAEGIQLLDSLLAPLMTGGPSAAVAGLAYCAVIGTCSDRHDIARAQQWTAALTDFVEARPDLVPYSGTCLVHRAELLQLHGAWPEAMEAAAAARARFDLSDDDRLAGMADYAAAEVDRLRGDLDQAEDGYREASRRGRDPQPGLALLRLAQGRLDDAAAAVRRLVADPDDARGRPMVLAAHVAVMLEVGDVDAARASCQALEQVAEQSDVPFVRATAQVCHSAMLLRDGKPGPALAASRRSLRDWLDLDAPYEAARAREQAGLALRALGDEDSATLEIEAARATYRALGARTDLARLGDGPDAAVPAADGLARIPLSAREVEVLRLVATGATNRMIATKLVLSEKTVARHLSNVFTKIDVPSRSAATAYAYEHGLVLAPAADG